MKKILGPLCFPLNIFEPTIRRGKAKQNGFPNKCQPSPYLQPSLNQAGTKKREPDVVWSEPKPKADLDGVAQKRSCPNPELKGDRLWGCQTNGNPKRGKPNGQIRPIRVKWQRALGSSEHRKEATSADLFLTSKSGSESPGLFSSGLLFRSKVEVCLALSTFP